MKRGWHYDDLDKYRFYMDCRSCGYTYLSDDDNYDDEFEKIEGTFITKKEETYSHYGRITEYDLYICPKCGMIVSNKRE